MESTTIVHEQNWAFIADLQSESWNEIPNWLNHRLPNNVDGYFIGGDIGHIDDTAKLYYRWINTLRKLREQTDAPMYYVLGNHEYYGSQDSTRVIHIARDICSKLDIKLLNRNYAKWGYWSVHGCTLWSDAHDADSDYHCTQLGIDINEYRTRHQTDVKWLTEQINLEQNIVLTHYTPSCEIRSGKNKRMYCTPLWPDVIAPKLWFCGHIHQNIKIIKANKELISHSWGRPGEIKNVVGPAYGTTRAVINRVTLSPRDTEY